MHVDEPVGGRGHQYVHVESREGSELGKVGRQQGIGTMPTAIKTARFIEHLL